jgi:thiol-disulfide isomerase/thioredoxin
LTKPQPRAMLKAVTYRKLIISAVIALILILGGYFFLQSPETPAITAPSSALIKPASPEDLKQIIQGLNSPLVLVNFWASWCEPCKAEFPSLLSLRKKFAKKGFKLVFVSIDEPRDFAAAEDFLRQNKVDFQTYYKGSQDIKFVNQIFPQWEGAVPASILFGPKLQIVDAWEGDATLAEFEERVTKHLGGS